MNVFIRYLFFIASIALIVPMGCPSPEHYYSHEGQLACESWDCEYGCGCDSPLFEDSFERSVGIGGTWHTRYIEDNCRNCPECCGSSVPLVGDSEHCGDCPGPKCICVQDGEGLWWINATIGDTEEEEDFGRYDDSDWPDQWTPPDDE